MFVSQVLPENAHELVNNKLTISVTRVNDGQNKLLSNFNSKEELIQASKSCNGTRIYREYSNTDQNMFECFDFCCLRIRLIFYAYFIFSAENFIELGITYQWYPKTPNIEKNLHMSQL